MVLLSTSTSLHSRCIMLAPLLIIYIALKILFSSVQSGGVLGRTPIVLGTPIIKIRFEVFAVNPNKCKNILQYNIGNPGLFILFGKVWSYYRINIEIIPINREGYQPIHY